MTLWETQWFTQKAEEVRKKTWIPWKSRKVPRRAILKDGHKNVHRNKIDTIRRWRYLQDIFTTLLDAQWRWTLQFLALEFFGCWLAFALIWWLIAFVHGDLIDDHLPDRQAETGWTPCVLNIHGFHSAFLYSLETQHTTGYGLRCITEECPEAIFILVCQCLIGMTLDSFAISIVFAKLIRSKHATNTVQFSRNAVITRRNGTQCFMFRIGDLRKSRLAGVNVRVVLLKTERTKEGEVLQSYQNELSLNVDEAASNPLLLWPVTMYHKIDHKSPLLDFTVPELMKNHKIEIVVILDATVESTGVSIEAKSSYISSEILWNHIFEPIISFNKVANCYEADWSRFDKTRMVNWLLPGICEGEADDETDNPESKLLFNQPDSAITINGDDAEEDEEEELFSRLNLEEDISTAPLNIDEFPSYLKPKAPEEVEKWNSPVNRVLKNKYKNFDKVQEDEDEDLLPKVTQV